jgi:hypothetical protein
MHTEEWRSRNRRELSFVKPAGGEMTYPPGVIGCVASEGRAVGAAG